MRINDIKVSKNFKLYEFECNDGSHHVMMDPEVIIRLQALRDTLGKPITINSAYRTKEYNAKIGGTKDSQHILGKAVDVVCEGVSPEKVGHVAKLCGFRGIGIYDTFTHLDVRKEHTEWRG